MKSILSILAFLLTNTFAFSQVGDMFPSLTATSLKNKKVSIPSDTKGKYTLIGIAYSKKSETALNTWYQPIYTEFLEKPESDGGLFVSEGWDVHVFFVPMVGGAQQVAQGKIEKEAKENVDPELHENVLLYFGAIDDYKKKLKFDDNEEPHFYVIDPDGKIVFHTKGSFSENKLEHILDIISE